MIATKRFLTALAAPLLMLALAGVASAQATRTWVSGVGDDANPCSRTAPCKTFAGAISKTAAGGEINTLDPGGFGGVTITKSISIIDEGVGEGGITAPGFNAIIVNAGPADVVTIRGLVIDGLTTGVVGVKFLAGGTLNVENCRIMNFQDATNGAGISFLPAGASQLNVVDSLIFNSGNATASGGILIQPQSGGTVNAVIDHTRVMNNLNTGIKVDGSVAGAGTVNLTITNSTISGNTGNGIQALSAAPAFNVMVDRSTVANNTAFGVRAQGGFATVRLTNSTVTGNGTGIGASGGGTLASYGNNNVSGNANDGTATAPTLVTK